MGLRVNTEITKGMRKLVRSVDAVDEKGNSIINHLFEFGLKL